MDAIKCLVCGQKPKLENSRGEGELHRLSCRCGAGPWHPVSTSVFDPMVNEWNTKNAPKPEEFKHPEAVHEIAEIPDVQPVSFHVPLLNDPE